MKKRVFLISIITLLALANASAQKEFRDYLRMYPIGDDANIGYKSSYREEETILLEATPNVRYSFYNNVLKGLTNGDEHVQAWYIAARPHLRIHTDNSLPVKTPSYRILLGTQQAYRVNDHDLFTIALESGHYSNGSSGCAFSETIPDGTPACDSVYMLITRNTDLSKILNRKNGNFSTNLTELILNYRLNRLDDDLIPNRVLSFKLGWTLYHDKILGLVDFGGFTKQDIKIYGRNRYLFGFEYIQNYRKEKRFSLSTNLELIQGAHPHVNPFRAETSATLFPFKTTKEFGFFVRHIYGHDNYNFRFVDSGNQLAFGITWTTFPPFAMNKISIDGPDF